MAVNVDLFNHLMELYPKTAEAMKELAVIKREVLLHYMEQTVLLNHQRLQTGIPLSLSEAEEFNQPTPPSSLARKRIEIPKFQTSAEEEEPEE